MATTILGASGQAIAEVDPSFRALRTTCRPLECIGWYSLAGLSGVCTGFGSGTVFYSFRNPGTNLLLVHRITLQLATTAAFTAPQALPFGLLRLQNFTASPSTGTQLYVGGQNKHRMSMSSITTAPDIRICNTASVSGGTFATEAQYMGMVNALGSGAVAVSNPLPLWQHDTGDYPFVMAQNDGFFIMNMAAMGAGGSVQLSVNVEYSEHSTF